MTEGEIIRLEREIAEDTEATQIRLSAQFCHMCGTRLNASGHCPHGCCDNDVTSAIISAYEKKPAPVTEKAACDWCGKELDDVDLYGWKYDPMTGLYAAMLCEDCLPDQDDEPAASGNYLAEETAYYAHPD